MSSNFVINTNDDWPLNAGFYWIGGGLMGTGFLISFRNSWSTNLSGGVQFFISMASGEVNGKLYYRSSVDIDIRDKVWKEIQFAS